MSTKKMVVLTGGTGTIKLINGLYDIIPEQLTIITNTADDFDFYSIHVSPDTDALLYSLSDMLDREKHWGLKDDSFSIKDIMETLDTKENAIATWFNLGDKDLAYCLYRTFLEKSGQSFSSSVQEIAKRLQIKSKIFPMADSRVETYFLTPQGEFHFEEFFIRLRNEPEINKIIIKGLEHVNVNQNLLKEIKTADLIVIGPSNPITSIGPILKIQEITQEILANPCEKLIISPVIGTQPVSGPTHKYMQSVGHEVSPIGIFKLYKDIGTMFMFDKTDETEFGLPLSDLASKYTKKVVFEDILIPTKEKQLDLARKVIKLLDM